MFKVKSQKSFIYKPTDYPELVSSSNVSSGNQMDFKKASSKDTIEMPIKKTDVILPGWIYIEMNKSNQISYTCIQQPYTPPYESHTIINNMISRWEKDAADYIELYGLDEYEKNFKMPTDSHLFEEEEEEEDEYEEDLYSDMDDEYY